MGRCIRCRLSVLGYLTVGTLLITGSGPFAQANDPVWEEGQEQTVAGPPALYLTWQRDPTTTMTVHWHTDHADDPSVIRYRPTDGTAWATAEGTKEPFPYTARWIHTVELTGLTPDTRYAFRRADADRVYEFVTMPQELEKPLRFVQGGDVYHEVEWMDAMNQRAAALDPAFIVIGGDLAYADGSPELVDRWHAYFESMYNHLVTDDGRMIPTVNAIGNHEMQGHFLHWRDDYEEGPEWRERVAPFFTKLFAFPGHPGYRTLDFGNYLSLVVLDTMHLNFIKGDQLEWLKAVLDDRAEYPHLFPIYHVPIYPSHRNPDDYVSREMRAHWAPLFEAAGVRLAFEHHDHAFKVTHPIRNGAIHPDGIVYVGDGAWGVRTREVQKDRWYLRTAASERHLYEVVLEPDRRSVRAFTADGRLLHEFEQPVGRPTTTAE